MFEADEAASQSWSQLPDLPAEFQYPAEPAAAEPVVQGQGGGGADVGDHLLRALIRPELGHCH